MLTRIAAILATLGWVHCASACLRTTIDERALQWSSSVVEARLTNVGERVELAKFEAAAERRGLPKSTHSYWYRIYTFQVTTAMDGTIRSGANVSVVRFFGMVENPLTACSQQITKANIGKSFTLLLRPETETTLNTGALLGTQRDPRNAKLHQMKAYVTVFASLSDELSAEQKADLKTKLKTVRAAEKAQTAAKVQQAVEQFVAADEEAKVTATREALLAMGPKALPTVKTLLDKQDELGKVRLQGILAEWTPPPVPILMEQPSQTGRNDGGNQE